MSEILGFAAAIAVGLVLGLIGAGGAILTVPIMVYLMGVNPVLATVYSLFIVGTTALIGSMTYLRNGQFSIKTSLAFGIPSLMSIFVTRKFVLPSIPDVVFEAGSFSLSKDHFVLFLFAGIMLFSSYSMILKKVTERETEGNLEGEEYIKLIYYGIFTGFVTGLVGAGGGFMIVPALIIFARIPVKAAIGTSLLIIAANSLSGFIGDLTGDYVIDWGMLLVFLGFAIVGIITGSYLTKFVSGQNLKKAFGWFVLVMGIYIIIRETLNL